MEDILPFEDSQKIIFSQKKISIPTDLRPMYKISLIIMMLKVNGHSKRLSYLQIQYLNWLVKHIEQVEDLYMKAWENNLKGITIYRDGCERQGILISNKKETNKVEDLKAELDKALNEALKNNPNECPMCGSEMIRTGGCSECQDCGYSPCSV